MLPSSPEKCPAERVAHHLPCTISHRGAASTSYLVVDGDIGLRSFRGRKLERGEFKIPDSHELVGVEIDEKDNINVKHKLKSDGTFYNHDDAVTEESPLPNALKWLKIAADLHAPNDATDVEGSGPVANDE